MDGQMHLLNQKGFGIGRTDTEIDELRAGPRGGAGEEDRSDSAELGRL